MTYIPPLFECVFGKFSFATWLRDYFPFCIGVRWNISALFPFSMRIKWFFSCVFWVILVGVFSWGFRIITLWWFSCLFGWFWVILVGWWICCRFLIVIMWWFSCVTFESWRVIVGFSSVVFCGCWIVLLGLFSCFFCCFWIVIVGLFSGIFCWFWIPLTFFYGFLVFAIFGTFFLPMAFVVLVKSVIFLMIGIWPFFFLTFAATATTIYRYKLPFLQK